MSAAEPEEKEVIADLRNPDVVTKYKAAAEIAQAALKSAIAACVDGAVIVTICQATDDFINAEAEKLWRKNKMLKGVGFPTCVSVNNIVGHFSPLADSTAAVKSGDVVKIDLGVHFDGFLSMVAHTIVVPGKAASSQAADTILAAYNASQLAARLLKAGGSNTAITKAIGEVCTDFKVNPVIGVLSHVLEQHLIDGEKVIANKEDVEHKATAITFETNEVYAIDIVVSSGEGKPKTSEERTTVHKRDPGHKVSLKVQAARSMMAEVMQKSPNFPFTLRALDQKNARLGIAECVRAECMEQYPVLTEKAGDIVAQFKFTALLMPSGTMVITGLPVDESIKSDKAVTKPENIELLKSAVSDKKKKKKAKAGAAEGDAPAAAGAAAANPEA